MYKRQKFERPLRDEWEIRNLAAPDPTDELRYVIDAVAEIRRALDGSVPLIGFSGSPYTLACYMVEGGASDDFRRIKTMLYARPDLLHHVLGITAQAVTAYLNAQIEAGAQAVQLFDSWAGVLSPADFDEYALRWAREVIARVKAHPAAAGVPVIYFANGCAPYLATYASSGADVLGVDWRVDLATVRAAVGDGVALQGNLDPGALYAPPDEIRRRVGKVLAQAGPVGHVFNLGHGVTPATDPEHVRAMVEAVRELSARA